MELEASEGMRTIRELAISGARAAARLAFMSITCPWAFAGPAVQPTACEGLKSSLTAQYQTIGLKAQFEQFQRDLPELRRRAAIIKTGADAILAGLTADDRGEFLRIARPGSKSDGLPDLWRPTIRHLAALKEGLTKNWVDATCPTGTKKVIFRFGGIVEANCRKPGWKGFFARFTGSNAIERTAVYDAEGDLGSVGVHLCQGGRGKADLCVTLDPIDLATKDSLSVDEILQKGNPSPMGLDQYLAQWLPKDVCPPAAAPSATASDDSHSGQAKSGVEPASVDSTRNAARGGMRGV